MEKSTLFEQCVEQFVTPEVDRQVDLAVDIANRLIDILSERRMSQKDLARLLCKTETEVSRWLMGTHNFTLATIAKIEVALGVEILTVSRPIKVQPLFSVGLNSMPYFCDSEEGVEELKAA